MTGNRFKAGDELTVAGLGKIDLTGVHRQIANAAYALALAEVDAAALKTLARGRVVNTVDYEDDEPADAFMVVVGQQGAGVYRSLTNAMAAATERNPND